MIPLHATKHHELCKYHKCLRYVYNAKKTIEGSILLARFHQKMYYVFLSRTIRNRHKPISSRGKSNRFPSWAGIIQKPFSTSKDLSFRLEGHVATSYLPTLPWSDDPIDFVTTLKFEASYPNKRVINDQAMIGSIPKQDVGTRPSEKIYKYH